MAAWFHTATMTTTRASELDPTGRIIRDRLLSVEEIAKELDLEQKTIADWIRNGSLPALKIGRSRKVLQSTFDKFLADKAASAEAEAAKKTHERNRREELKRFQALEPDQKWDERLCIGCFTPVNTTRHQRLDGRVLCNPCSSHVRENSYSKEMWDRRIRLEVEERNQIAEEQLWPSREQDKAMGRRLEPVREWITYRCGHCDKPQCIRLASILDLGYEPKCSHEPPYGTGDSIDWRHYDDSQERMSMLSALAQLEANERNRAEDDVDPLNPSWWVDHCAHCDRELAAVNTDILFTGQALCRCCRNREIDDEERLLAMRRALKNHRPSTVTYPYHCDCKSRDIPCRVGIGIHASWTSMEFRLSFCETETPEELESKKQDIRNYGELVGLSEKAISDLVDVLCFSLPF